MSNYLTTDTELTSIANAIRTKGGTSGQLEYPTGFVTAIGDIPSSTYSETLLWTNPDLTAAFPNQVLRDIDINGYDAVKMIFTSVPGAGAANYRTYIIPVSDLGSFPNSSYYPLIGIRDKDNQTDYYRMIYGYSTLTEIGITDCFYGNTSGASVHQLKPVQIYGVNF